MWAMPCLQDSLTGVWGISGYQRLSTGKRVSAGLPDGEWYRACPASGPYRGRRLRFVWEEWDVAEDAYTAGLEAGFAAYERGEHEDAIKLWLPLARRGYTEAQYNLAVVYANGSSLQRDLVKAAVWFRKAALQGDAEAQFNLGVMFRNGDGCSRILVRHLLGFGWPHPRVIHSPSSTLALPTPMGKASIRMMIRPYVGFERPPRRG
jgi:hypothetical protein